MYHICNWYLHHVTCTICPPFILWNSKAEVMGDILPLILHLSPLPLELHAFPLHFLSFNPSPHCCTSHPLTLTPLTLPPLTPYHCNLFSLTHISYPSHLHLPTYLSPSRRLNAELEAKTTELVKEAEQLMVRCQKNIVKHLTPCSWHLFSHVWC